MNYVDDNPEFMEQPDLHSILLLDTSGSMDGEPWKELIQSVEKFIQVRIKSGFDEDRISIFTFNNECQKIVENVPVEESLVEQIQFLGGGTNYGPPLQTVERIIKNDNEKKFLVLFMSDGAPNTTPIQELIDLNKPEILDKILTFWTVLHGDDQRGEAEMLRIATRMRGEMRKSTDSLRLPKIFAEIARNEL